MTEIKTPHETLVNEMAAHAAELTKKHGANVTPILFYDQADENQTDPLKGYLKEPNRLAKLRILDKSSQIGDFSASAEMIDLCLIKEESDPRIYSEAPENDKFFLGACYRCQQLITMSFDQIKKK